MVTTEDVPTSGIHGMLQQGQRVCEVGGETVSTSTIDVVGLTCKGAAAKLKNAKLSAQNTDMKDEFA